MGCPSAGIQEGGTVPSTKASQGGKVSHIPTRTHRSIKSIDAIEKGYVLETTQQPIESFSRKATACGMQYRQPQKRSVLSNPKLDQVSPSDSNSSSKIFNFGWSSSSSPSSTLSLNEIGSLALGELTLSRGIGKKENQGWSSSPEDSSQSCYTPSKTWDDSEIQFKRLLEAEILDGSALKQAADEPQSDKTRKQRQTFSNRKHLEFKRHGFDAHEYLAGQALQKNLSDVEGKKSCMSSLFPESHAVCTSKHTGEDVLTHHARNANSRLSRRRSAFTGVNQGILKKNSNYCNYVAFDIYEDGLLDGCYSGSEKFKSDLPAFGGKGLNQTEGSALKNFSCKNTHLETLPRCNVGGCSPALRETAVGTERRFVQLAAFPTPSQIGTSLRASWSDQPSDSQSFSSPQIKLNVKHSIDRACSKFSCEYYDAKARTPVGKNESSRVFLEQELPDNSNETRSVATLNSYYGMRKNTKLFPAAVSHEKTHDRKSLILVNDGGYREKTDSFTPHAPLSAKDSVLKEENKRNTSPACSYKRQWDWRSKTSQEKEERRKPAVITKMEGMPATCRSHSLPKMRSGAQKPKLESKGLLDRIFTSPIRARSTRQVDGLATKKFCKRRSEIEDIGPAVRGTAKAGTSNILSNHNKTAGVAVRPLLPIGYKNVEAACKPFLPSSKAGHCLQTPEVTSGVERLESSEVMSHLSNTLPTCMSHAQIHCTYVDGARLYTMTILDSGEVMLVKACWQENHSSRESSQWQYLFYSGQARPTGMGSFGWWSRIKKDGRTAMRLSGIMKVNQCRDFPAEEVSQSLKVIEFVLYDAPGAEVSHSQRFRFYAPNKPYLWSRGSISSLLHSGSHSDQSASLGGQHAENHVGNIVDLCAGSENPITARNASNFHKVKACHRQTFSLDGWSNSEPPDFVASSTSYSAQAELAAMVIQLSAERDSNLYDSNQVSQNPQGWGLNFLNEVSEPIVTLPDLPMKGQPYKSMSLKENAIQQDSLGSWSPQSDLNPVSSGSCNCASSVSTNQRTDHVFIPENFQGTRPVENVRNDTSVTLLLPTKQHSVPTSRSKGPSSLIQRWRSGGLCECGGWDLGCGINVISSDCSKESNTSKVHSNGSAEYNGWFCLFSQGSRRELTLGLSVLKQGDLKLIFRKTLPPLQALATVVAMLHSHDLNASHSLPWSPSANNLCENQQT